MPPQFLRSPVRCSPRWVAGIDGKDTWAQFIITETSDAQFVALGSYGVLRVERCGRQSAGEWWPARGDLPGRQDLYR